MEKSKVSFSINVDICIEKDDEGYHAFCPAFKGLHTGGSTIRETLNNAKNALAAYVISLLKHHEPIPCCRILREEIAERSGEKIKLFNTLKQLSANENIAIPELAA